MKPAQKPPLERLIELQRLLLDFCQIERATHRSHRGNVIHDNDVEHSYNLAMIAWFLAPHFPELNQDKLIRFALAHDLVEIYAGDTHAYSDVQARTRKAIEEKAALQKLRQEWPDFAELVAEIADYESKSTPEARFIYALDKILPIMMNYIIGGYSWRHSKITLEMLHNNKKDKVAVSPEIEPYYKALYELLSNSPHLFP